MANKKSDREKMQLEHDAAKIFMRRFEAKTGKTIRDIIHNEPSKPDITCHLEGETLDLEIAHIYGSEAEAIQILGHYIGESITNELHQLQTIRGAYNRLLSALNRILFNKSKKYYATEKVWLVLRNAHPAWTAEKIKALRTEITIPENHPFDQIWIIGDFAGISDIVRLYPANAPKALDFCPL
jgi:hypothetical protein